MLKVSIQNLNKITTHMGEFNTLEEAQEWINKNIKNNSWGLSERWVHKDRCSQEDIDSALESKNVIDREFIAEHTEIVMQYDSTDPENPIEIGEVEIKIPEVPEVSHIEYLLPAQFTYEIEDITEQHNKEKHLKKAIAQGAMMEQACKDCLNYIRSWNMTANLTTKQINQMKVDFKNIKEYLLDGQPWGAKAEIDLVVDEKYSDLKENLLFILSKVIS